MATELSFKKGQKDIGRPLAEFHPSLWGDLFLNYTPDDEETRAKREKEIKELKEEVKKDPLANGKNPLEQLSFIDAIQRLGVAYHFEEKLEHILQTIFESNSSNDHPYKEDNLSQTSLYFRVLRQNGINVTSDIFKEFTDEEGKFKESLTSDVEGLLSLYEASHVRIHGEDILDEAFAFATTHLKSIAISLSGLLSERVSHALEHPLYRTMSRLEARQFISIYEHDPSHNKDLLKFAKLDFNFLLSLHKEELTHIARWWKDLLSTYGFAKDRLAEAYFWTLGTYYEPRYSLGRKIFCKVFLLVSIFDDIYDAYGVIEELELLTQVIQRWDKSAMNQLPDYLKNAYQALLDAFEEYEQDLAEEGRSHLVQYAREQMIILCESYLQEARWRNEKCIPSFDEYIQISELTFGYVLGIIVSFLGMGEVVRREAFEWVRQRPKLVIAIGVMGRIKNDMGGNMFQQQRDHVASSVQCYMKQYGVYEEKAREDLNKRVENKWKDINEGMLRPYPISKPAIATILELTRMADVIYQGEDGYTEVSQTIQKKIALVLVDQVPL